MKYLPIVMAGLRRRRPRTLFTLLSTIVAFALFGLLQSVNSGFESLKESSKLDRLIVGPKNEQGPPLAGAGAERIRALPGIRKLAVEAVFFGNYQEPKNQVFVWAVVPDDWLAVYSEYALPPAQLDSFRKKRNAFVASRTLQARFKWKLGDTVSLQSPIPQKDGQTTWWFEFVGALEPADKDAASEDAGMEFGLINYEYYDAARAMGTGTVNRFSVLIGDPEKAGATAKMIDSVFANSSNETRTQSQRAQMEFLLRQLGDITFITNAIVGSVLFALLFLIGNTMLQSVRERIPEFAVLKTIGFADGSLFVIVLSESLLLCLVAAIVGLLISVMIFPLFKDVFGMAQVSWRVLGAALTAASVLALISASIPILQVRRLQIVQALRVQ